MQDISDLLQEAKPLYFSRKRKRQQLKTIIISVFFAAGLWGFYPQTSTERYDYQLLSESEYNSLNRTTGGSVIEEIGMPADDYGLLMVG